MRPEFQGASCRTARTRREADTCSEVDARRRLWPPEPASWSPCSVSGDRALGGQRRTDRPTNTSVVTHPPTTVTAHPLTIVAQATRSRGTLSTIGPRGTHRAVTHQRQRAHGDGDVHHHRPQLPARRSTARRPTPATVSTRQGHLQGGPGPAAGRRSPYTITADYCGDANFAGSTGTTTETVSRAKSHTKLKVSPSKPRDGSPTRSPPR